MGFREDLEKICGRVEGSFAASVMVAVVEAPIVATGVNVSVPLEATTG